MRILKNLLILVFCLSSTLVYSQIFNKYQETTNGKSRERTAKFEKTEFGYRITTEHIISEMDSTRAMLRWSWTDTPEQTIFSAYRSNDIVYLEGTLKGKKVSKKYDTKGLPWYFSLDFSLISVIESGNSRAKFYSISPIDLRGGELEVEIQSMENQIIAGNNRYVQKLRVSLTGILAPFWDALFWYDLQKQNICVKHRFNRGPGTPTMYTELLSSTGNW